MRLARSPVAPNRTKTTGPSSPACLPSSFVVAFSTSFLLSARPPQASRADARTVMPASLRRYLRMSRVMPGWVSRHHKAQVIYAARRARALASRRDRWCRGQTGHQHGVPLSIQIESSQSCDDGSPTPARALLISDADQGLNDLTREREINEAADASFRTAGHRPCPLRPALRGL